MRLCGGLMRAPNARHRQQHRQQQRQRGCGMMSEFLSSAASQVCCTVPRKSLKKCDSLWTYNGTTPGETFHKIFGVYA